MHVLRRDRDVASTVIAAAMPSRPDSRRVWAVTAHSGSRAWRARGAGTGSALP